MKSSPIVITPKSFLYGFAAVAGIWLAWELRSVILIFFIAFILNAALRPVIEFVEKRLKVSRGLAISITYVTLLSSILLLGFVVVESLVAQIKIFALNTLPQLPKILNQVAKDFPFLKSFLDLTSISTDLNAVDNLSKVNSGEIVSMLFQAVSTVGSQGLALIWKSIGGVFTIFIIVVVSIYMVKGRRNFHEGVWELLPKKIAEIIRTLLGRIEKSLGSWLLGQLTLMFIIGAASYLIVLLPGIFDPNYRLDDFALIIGIIAGLLEGLPNIGPTITLVLALIIALISGGGVIPVFYILFSFTILQQLEGLFIVPQVMQKAVDLHPIISILAVLAGFNLGGPMGALLSVPVVGALQIIVLELLKHWKETLD